jgi:uncharacterized protein YkwD
VRLRDALYRLRRPRPSLIVPVVLVCGVLAGIALVLPSYTPAVTGTDGALGLESTGAASAGDLAPGAGSGTGSGSGSSERAGDASRTATATPSSTAAPSSTSPAPAPVVETPAAGSSTPTAEEAPTGSSAPAPSPSAHSAPPAPDTSTAASAPATGVADASAEGQILALVNQQRATAGCGALTADGGLASLARTFSADMRDRGFFSHTDPDGLSPFDRGNRAGVTVLGENIAYGQPDAAAVMTAWMNSAGHRANILNCSYTRLGVGVAYGPGGPWWTQDFA